MLIRLLWVVLLLAALGWGCASQESAAAKQITQGKALYQAHCARCHGDQGQGKVGPALIGPRHGLGGYGTAQGLFDYTSRVMPFDAPGTLKAEEHWTILAFILNANGLLPPETALGSENAQEIRLVR